MFRRFAWLLILVLAASAVLALPQAMAQGQEACGIAVDEAQDTGEPDPTPTAVIDATGDTDLIITSESATAALDCADAVAYPGPFTNTPAAPSNSFAVPRSISAPEAPAVAVPVLSETPSSSSLAHSGSEIFVLAYLGTGLLAFGAVALGMRRTSVPR